MTSTTRTTTPSESSLLGLEPTDGNAYVLEDGTVKAGPATWGNPAVSAYTRHEADIIVAEVNFGGAMVQQTIEVARKAEGCGCSVQAGYCI